MARSTEKIYVVKNAQQRRSLTSPLRMEILEQFALSTSPNTPPQRAASGGVRKRGSRGASIAEVARRMGRRPDSLYHHVRLLTKLGLLVEAGSRKSGKRSEVLYRPVAAMIAQPCDPSDPASVKTAVDTVAATFRMAEREMRDAIESRAFVVDGDARNFIARRLPVRMSAAALRKVNRHIDSIMKITERENRRFDDPHVDRESMKPMSITIALLPMTARERTVARHDDR